MANTPSNIFSFIRPLATEDKKIYDGRDFLNFRPSYEYLQSKENRSCQHCKSPVYERFNDFRILTLLETVTTRHKTPLFQTDNAVLDAFESYNKRVHDFLDGLFGESKLNKDIKSSCKSICDQLKISDSLLVKPLFHRCNACLCAWPLHLEIKQRLELSNSFLYRFLMRSQGSIPSIFHEIGTIPLTKNYLNGLTLLNDPSENLRIGQHVYDFKRFIMNHDQPNLLAAVRKKIQAGNAGGGLSDLAKFVASMETDFYTKSVIQLQARLATYHMEKIHGRLEPREETAQFNRICSDILLLMEEIERYRNM